MLLDSSFGSGQRKRIGAVMPADAHQTKTKGRTHDGR